MILINAKLKDTNNNDVYGYGLLVILINAKHRLQAVVDKE